MKHLLLTLALIMSAAFSATANETRREKLDSYIHDYLMENPAVLKRAIDNVYVHLENAQQEKAQGILQQKQALIYNNRRDFSLGRSDAPIRIVEFFDYNCGYCKRGFDALMRIARENGDVRLIFKEFPVLGKASRKAAEAALTLTSEKDFVRYHTHLMTHKNRLDETTIRQALKQVRANPTTSFERGTRPDIQNHLRDTHALARALGINGTPSFIINDKIYKGALSYKELQTAIMTARESL